MAFNSINIYHSYLAAMEPLSDAERGRLLTACLEYSISGKAPDLRGNERFIFPSWKEQIDRDKEKYAEKCKTSSEAAKKRWRKPSCESMPTHADAYGNMPTHADACKEKEKEKEKVKEKEKEKEKEKDDYRRLRAGAREGDDGLSDDEKEILDYCHDLIGAFTPAQDRKVLAAAAGMSADSAIDAICIAYERGARAPEYVIAAINSQKEHPERKPGGMI